MTFKDFLKEMATDTSCVANVPTLLFAAKKPKKKKKKTKNS